MVAGLLSKIDFWQEEFEQQGKAHVKEMQKVIDGHENLIQDVQKLRDEKQELFKRMQV